MQRKASPWTGGSPNAMMGSLSQPSSSPAAASGRKDNSPRLKSRSRKPTGREAIFLIAACSFFVGHAHQAMHLEVHEGWKANNVEREATLLAYRHPSFHSIWIPPIL